MNDASGLIGAAIVFLPPLILFIWIVATRNRLITLGQMIDASWSGIDTELRRRYDLIPNLVETVKGYAAHEQAVFKSVTEARERAMASTGGVKEQAQDQNELIRSLRHLLAISEGYPELKASTNFLHLQKELVNTEDRIQAARRFFNGNIRDFNTLIDCFPTSIIAGMMGLRHRDYYEIEDVAARGPVSAQF